MITKEIENYIYAKGVFTGSRKFNCHTDKSDYDYLIYDQTKNYNYFIQQGFIYEEGQYIGEYFFSVKGVTESGKYINVLFFSDKLEYECYLYATEWICKLMLANNTINQSIYDKETRIIVFNKLKDIYRETHKRE